jgi:hypothetical protein
MEEENIYGGEMKRINSIVTWYPIRDFGTNKSNVA